MIAQVDGVTNAVAIDADTMAIDPVGPGAGGAATASAVVADIVDIGAPGAGCPPFGRPAGRLDASARARRCSAMRAAITSGLSAVDRPGTAAAIAQRMAEQNISLESIVQRHRTGSRMAARTRKTPPARCPSS